MIMFLKCEFQIFLFHNLNDVIIEQFQFSAFFTREHFLHPYRHLSASFSHSQDALHGSHSRKNSFYWTNSKVKEVDGLIIGLLRTSKNISSIYMKDATVKLAKFKVFYKEKFLLKTMRILLKTLMSQIEM